MYKYDLLLSLYPNILLFSGCLKVYLSFYNVPGVFFCLALKATTREEKRERKEDTYYEETLTTSIH